MDFSSPSPSDEIQKFVFVCDHFIIIYVIKIKRNCLLTKTISFYFYSVTCTCCTCKTFKVRSSTIFSRSVPNGSFRSVGQGEKSNSKIERLLIHNMVVRYKN